MSNSISLFDKFIMAALGDVSKDSFQTQLLKFTVFISTVFMFSSVFLNYFIQQNSQIDIISVVSFLAFLVCYLFSRFKFRFLPVLYFQFTLSLISIGLGWYYFDGIDGMAFYTLLIVAMIYSMITRGTSSVIIFLVIIVFYLVLVIVEFFNPSIVRNYQNDAAKFIDLTVTVLFTISVVFIVVKLVFNKFIERETVYLENQILEEKNNIITNQNDELIHLNATKDKFFSIISHDLKNPISNFHQAANLAYSEFNSLDEKDLLDILKMLDSSSKEIYELLNNLLIWARSQQSRVEFNPEPCNLNYIILNNISLQKLSASNKKISIEFDNNLDRELFADINLVNTVVRNLISNAIKFSFEGSKIIVSTSILKDGKFALTQVKDFGIGISAENIEKLFKPDSNFKHHGTKNEKGTGLGLILCKEFIEMHKDCVIYAESTLGVGTTFSFTLPLLNPMKIKEY